MTTDLSQKVFLDANQEPVVYDGSPVSWRVSAYVLIKQNNQILIIKDLREKTHDVVGGGIEFGESIEQAIARECLEEAGAQVKLGVLLDAQTGWFSHRNGNFYQTLQLFYEAELVGELQPPTDENVIWREFVPLSEVGTKYKLPSFVEKVIKNS